MSKLLWTKDEDDFLIEMVNKYGKKWVDIAQHLPFRSKDQCYRRWHARLDPKLNGVKWSEYETDMMLKLHSKHGPQWALMAKSLIGRSRFDIKNHFARISRNQTKNKREHYRNFFLKSTAYDQISIKANKYQKIYHQEETTDLINNKENILEEKY